jgi:hypothetical protein
VHPVARTTHEASLGARNAEFAIIGGSMSSVIKKRRRKISRHKYRKRLKRERHKRK